MSITVTDNKITSDSGKVIFKENDKTIEVRSNQVFITDKFISVGQYVFTKGTYLPLVSLIIDARENQNSTVILDFQSMMITESDGAPCDFAQAIAYLPKEALAEVLLDNSITKNYQISVARGGGSQTNTELAQKEIDYFVESKGFNSSYYDKDNAAPSILLNNQDLPYTNEKITGNPTDTGITFTVNKNISYITVFVKF